MFVKAVKKRLNVDLESKPPTWPTIESNVIRALKKHKVKRKRKVTGDGDRQDEGQTNEELQTESEENDLFDNVLQQYETWVEFKNADKATKKRKL